VVGESDKIHQKVPVWHITPGETPWKNLEKLAKRYCIYVTDTPQGEVLLTDINSTRTNIVISSNEIEEIIFEEDESSRFSHYKVIGQHQEKNYSIEIEDKEIKRYRPTLKYIDLCENEDGAKLYAETIKKVDHQRSHNLSILIANWIIQDLGVYWNINRIIKIVYPYWKINNNFIISGVKFIFDPNQGKKTWLELERVKDLR
jgi:prophage tail gpP-like protein